MLWTTGRGGCARRRRSRRPGERQKGRDVVGVQPLNVAVAILGLHHAGLYVASLERSIAFYREIFGLEVAERFDFGDEQLALLRVGNLFCLGPDGERIELIEVSPSAE